MLTDEQRQAIQARLAGLTGEEGQTQETELNGLTEETTESVNEQAPGTNKEVPNGEEKNDTPQPDSASRNQEKMVPLSEVAKLRAERRELRQQLEEVRSKAARLEGYVAGTKRTQPTGDKWLDEIFAEAEAPDNETEDSKTSATDEPAWVKENKPFIEELKAERGRQLFEKVLETCMKQDPTVPKGFLVDQLAAGRSPEDALSNWAAWRPATVAPVTQVTEQKAKPVAPRTVPAAPSGKDTTVPKGWDGISAEVRRRMSGK